MRERLGELAERTNVSARPVRLLARRGVLAEASNYSKASAPMRLGPRFKELNMKELMQQVTPIIKLFVNSEIYVVGGTLRDMFIGRNPKDLDFSTPLAAREIEKLLQSAGFETWRIDKVPEVVGTRLQDKVVEISSYQHSTIETDLGHKDFTINAMATKDGTIIDPYGGLKDIEKNIIRATKSPLERFVEDPFRMLRAIRFVSTLGFRLEENTKNRITTYAQSILTTSKDRWLSELTKLLMGNNVKPALELLFKTRLLGYLLPELYPITMIPRNQSSLTKDLWYHTKIVVSKSKSTSIIRWAALLHDIAKPQTMMESIGGTHFFQHEYLGSEIANAVLSRLKAGINMRHAVRSLVALHQRIGDIVSRKNNPPVSINALRRLARDCDDRKCKLEDLIELFAADCSSGRKDIIERQQAHADLLRKALEDIVKEDLRPKLPKGIGKQIMNHFNLEPGPRIGELKEKLDSMLISGKIQTNMTIEQMFVLLEGK